MKVLKFGGTSVGTTESLLKVREIVSSQEGRVVVVVSAMGGVTNALIKMTELAIAKDSVYEATLQEIRSRHAKVIAEVVPGDRKSECESFVMSLIDENLASLLAMLCLNEIPADIEKNISKTILSFGETLSSAIVTMMLDAEPHYAPNFIKTNWSEGNDVLNAGLTNQLIAEEFGKSSADIIVTQGFIARDSKNERDTNLGRGGSDFTAALIAAALKAESLEIWTDVDGFLTADPRIVPNAKLVERMTYSQAESLCIGGAKVVYFPTITPVAEHHIPTWVKNTFNQFAKGTLISDEESTEEIVGVTSKYDTLTVVTKDGADLAKIADVLMKGLIKNSIMACPVSRTVNSVTMKVATDNMALAVKTAHGLLIE